MEIAEKEKLIERLRTDGFQHIYEWKDGPGTIYPEHAHKGKVSFYIIQGDIDVVIEGKKTSVKSGERMDVPVRAKHSAIVGPEGCTFIVGEEIEGDS